MTWLDARALKNLRDFVVQGGPCDIIGDRFELGERLGEGGMGIVYAGVDRETGREVAVKIVALGAQHDEARFLREATALARVEHDAVVSYIAHGTHAGAPFLVMERLRGVTLAERLARGASGLAIREALEIVRRLADGLAAVHAEGITHRDLKPSNVFLVDDRPERPRLLDFGLARLAGGATLTQSGALVGTPGYMAPEQVRGERAGPEADVFALGCILYECVARRAAFSADRTDAVLAQILLEQPRPLDVVTTNAPKALAVLVDQMLGKDPMRRPDASEVARSLDAIARALPLPSLEPVAPGVAPGVAEGQVLAGKYRVERRIGEGGMGIVVAAKHVDLGTRVAVKLMRGDERFLREARAASRLETEHVARVLDAGRTADGTPYMVMEHLNGIDLARRLRDQGPLPMAKAVDCVLQACEAIAEAHALGIVHRDLKPSNLFLVTRRDGSEMVKVLDFGISKVTKALGETSNDITVTDAKAVLGSVAYMSPEQLQASTDIDARSDVWSLGIVLHELITGARPFDGESAAAVGARIAGAKPVRLPEVRSDAPILLEAAVLKCLEKDPSARFADVRELAVALVPHGTDAARTSVGRIAGLLEGTSRARPEARAVRHSPWRLAALGVVMFAAGIAMVSFIVVAGPSEAGDASPTAPAVSITIGSPPPAAPPPSVSFASGSPLLAPPSPSPVEAFVSAPSTARPASAATPPSSGGPVTTVNPTAHPTRSPPPTRPSPSAPSVSSRGTTRANVLDLRDPALEGR